ncbi:Chromosome partition protein Smc [Massilia sp. Bi118]|uniref:DNA-binding protein n=1 Tax=Massilia sp. Bi118 TaxID=2822346 RepID=UPI001D4EECBF|nr:DNA-binding protein [Massilia sp. Bi118]CAH0197071.1 Chromosome partition protein Smc [Massilia sp. Bi118]
MTDFAPEGEALRADVEMLRLRFPKTVDLYRETCAVMFFRYGITPTTNSLYQLVRKGSMSVPSEVLRDFWTDLRRQTRVVVDNAGLPDDLRESAGKLLGQLWSNARREAEDSVAHLKVGLTNERDALLIAQTEAAEQTARLSSMLDQANQANAAKDEDLVRLREQLSAVRATVENVGSQLIEAQSRVDQLQQETVTSSREHAAEIDKVTARVVQAEQRYIELEKRTLVELDRERTMVSRLQKLLESERHTAAVKHEKLQADAQAMQIRLAHQEQALTIQHTISAALKDERDSAMARADANKDTVAALTGQLAVEQTRVHELREQIRYFVEHGNPGAALKQPSLTAQRGRRSKARRES